MKILHVINNLGSGGAEKLIEESLPLMNKIKGVKVRLLLLSDRENVFDNKLKEEGIDVDIIPFRKPLSLLNIFYIRKYITKGNYDIIHVHLFPSQYWVSLACKLTCRKKPVLITTEHNTYNRRREKRYFKYIDRFIYSSYDKIISISNDTKKAIISWLEPSNKMLEKFIVIENGININRFKEAKPYRKDEINKNFTETTKLLCMVGRFTDQKDQKTLIRAILELPKEVHLLLVGEGTLRQENERIAKRLGVEDRVHFLGFRNDVERILKTVDIVVLSSHWEGFGLVATEGMAAGKPVIASDVAGLKNVVKEAGMLFTVGDYKDLSKKIEALLINNYEYRRISQKCSIKAEKYTIETMVNKYIQLYKDVLSEL